MIVWLVLNMHREFNGGGEVVGVYQEEDEAKEAAQYFRGAPLYIPTRIEQWNTGSTSPMAILE